MNELINKNMVLEARIEAILDDKKVLVDIYCLCHFTKFNTIVLPVSTVVIMYETYRNFPMLSIQPLKPLQSWSPRPCVRYQ